MYTWQRSNSNNFICYNPNDGTVNELNYASGQWIFTKIGKDAAGLNPENGDVLNDIEDVSLAGMPAADLFFTAQTASFAAPYA